MKRMCVKYALCLLVAAAGLYSCTTMEVVNLRGFTQGTTYNILYEKPEDPALEEQIAGCVESVLLHVDTVFSLYNAQSLLSRLNRNETRQIEDTLFAQVFQSARRIWQESDGLFDITVGPLVDAWGFGPDALQRFDESKLDSLMALVGMNKVIIDKNRLLKTNPGIHLDMNAIAQGFTVDLLARMLEEKGCKNYLAEVGGEIRTGGSKGGRKKWTVGVDRPEENNLTPGADLQIILGLSGQSLATSGNYRKFYVEDGVKYVHTIDPRTGYPVKHSLLSATIIAPDCMTADGYATACMVAGLEQAREMINKHDELEAYLIYADEKGRFKVWQSAGFEPYIQEYVYPSPEEEAQ